jgi:hypothetical protein
MDDTKIDLSSGYDGRIASWEIVPVHALLLGPDLDNFGTSVSIIS